MFGRRIVIGLASAVLVVGALGAAYDWQSTRQSANSAMPDVRSPSQKQIADLEPGLQAHPDDTEKLGELGGAYLQKARETGDPAYIRGPSKRLPRCSSRIRKMSPAWRVGLAGALAAPLPRGARGLGPSR